MTTQCEVIVVDISSTGEIFVKAEGFSGKECFGAAMELESSLGHVKRLARTAKMGKTKRVHQ